MMRIIEMATCTAILFCITIGVVYSVLPHGNYIAENCTTISSNVFYCDIEGDNPFMSAYSSVIRYYEPDSNILVSYSCESFISKKIELLSFEYYVALAHEECHCSFGSSDPMPIQFEEVYCTLQGVSGVKTYVGIR